MLYDDRECENDKCRRIFSPTRRWQKYCSPECRSADFYFRKFGPQGRRALDDLNDYIEQSGPTERQKADWTSRKAPPPDERRLEQRELEVLEKAQEIAEEKIRALEGRRAFVNMFGTEEDKAKLEEQINAQRSQRHSNEVHGADSAADNRQGLERLPTDSSGEDDKNR